MSGSLFAREKPHWADVAIGLQSNSCMPAFDRGFRSWHEEEARQDLAKLSRELAPGRASYEILNS